MMATEAIEDGRHIRRGWQAARRLLCEPEVSDERWLKTVREYLMLRYSLDSRHLVGVMLFDRQGRLIDVEILSITGNWQPRPFLISATINQADQAVIFANRPDAASVTLDSARRGKIEEGLAKLGVYFRACLVVARGEVVEVPRPDGIRSAITHY